MRKERKIINTNIRLNLCDEQLQRITELQDFIKDQSSDLTVFDEALVKRWLKQIVIWPTHCTVELKSGLKVDVER